MTLDFVRATYWLGAMVDALAAVQLLLPTSVGFLGLHGLRSPGAAGQPAVTAAVLMLGFAAVLIWAHLRTRHRRMVLAIALVVVVALTVSNLALGFSGASSWVTLLLPLVVQTILIIMFALSIRIARLAAIDAGIT